MDTCPASMDEGTAGTTASNDWYTQQGLIVESITPPLPSQNEIQTGYISTADHFQKAYSVIMITTKTYSTPSFISYLFNSLSHFIHHSIIYIDDSPPPSSLPINNYHQHPATSTISYLICLDHFDSHIRQTLDSILLNHLTITHTLDYLFLLLNVPSHEVIKYFYSKVMDQRTIVVLHYHHSSFEDEALLLCSGDRRTYEEIRSNLLKCLCAKVNYIESTENANEQLSSCNPVSSDNQSKEIKSEPIVDIPQQTFKSDVYVNNSNTCSKYLSASSTANHSKAPDRQKPLSTCARRALKQKSKQRLPMNSSSSKYHVHNILDTVHSSK